MASVHATSSDQSDARSVGASDGRARLGLKPKGCVRGALDGAWWPRSANPAIELTALIEAVGMPVRRVALNMAGWDNAPRRILPGSGERVSVDWFRISGVRLVRIVGTDDQRIDLLLIPVDTEEVTAELALAMATEGHDPHITATVCDRSGTVGPAAQAKASPDGAPGRDPTAPGPRSRRRTSPAD